MRGRELGRDFERQIKELSSIVVQNILYHSFIREKPDGSHLLILYNDAKHFKC